MNIIKCFLIFIISLVLPLYIFSIKKLNFDDKTGDYVYYYDTRIVNYKDKLIKRNGLLGIMYLDKDYYLCRYYNLENKDETLISCKIRSNDLNIEELKIEKLGKDKDFYKTISADILNFYNYKEVDLSNFPEEVVKTIEYSKDYSLVDTFKFWIPIFHLYDEKELSSGEYRLKLIAFGRIKSKDDKYFFTLNMIPNSKDGPKLNLSVINNNKVKLNDIELTLDDNWIKRENIEMLPKPNIVYLINKISNWDSVLFVEEMNFSKYGILNTYEFIKMVLFSSNAYIDPNSINIETYSNIIKFEFNSMDSRNFLYSKSIHYYIPVKNNIIKIINFNAFLSIYNDNKLYFDNIIKQSKYNNKNIIN